MDRPEKFVKLLDIAIDNVFGVPEKPSSYTNTEVELEADRLLFIPLVLTPLVVDEELNKLYNALALKLYIRILRF